MRTYDGILGLENLLVVFHKITFDNLVKTSLYRHSRVGGNDEKMATCSFHDAIIANPLKNNPQQPIAEKTHTYGSVDHHSGRTCTAIFFGNKTKGG